MEKRILLSFYLVSSVSAFLCSQLNVGTDIGNIGSVVKGGVVQSGWTFNDASYRSAPPDGIMFFYAQGLEFLGPDFQITEFHHEDERRSPNNSWLFMNVTVDDREDEWLSEYTVYKVTQQCNDKEGGTTLHLNITLGAAGCNPITINWLKVCGEPTITKIGFSIGFSPTSTELVRDGAPSQGFNGNLKRNSYTVSSDDDDITLYMYIGDYGTPTFFQPPYIITDHEVMYPSLNGTGVGGGWLSSEPKTVQISFNCLTSKSKKEEVMFIVELPYFHNIETHFYKQCGTKKKAKAKGWGWAAWLFWLALLGGSSFLIFLTYKWNQGESIVKYVPCLECFSSMYSNYTSASRSYGERFDKELPDYGDEKTLNVKTSYGTL